MNVTEELVSLIELKKYIINSLNDVKVEKSTVTHLHSTLVSLNAKINSLLLSKRFSDYLREESAKK